jgi:hypothetical protein
MIWLALAGNGGRDTTPLDFPDLARTLLDEHGLDAWIEAGPKDKDFAAFVESPVFARVAFGTLELFVPVKSLSDPEIAEEFKTTAGAVVDMQASWQAWKDPQRAGEFAEDWKTLAKWVKTWSRGKLAHADGGASFYDSFEASEGVRASAARVAEALRADEETRHHFGELGRLVYAPKRRDFLQMAALVGWLDEGAQKTFWNDKVIEHTLEWVGWTQIVCMEFTLLPVDPNLPFKGVDMNADDKTGLAQYMAERAAALLLRREFWRQDAHFYEQTLASNLVIAAAGRNNLRSGEWKLEIHTSGSSTQPYERFVPGGNPGGGTLPPNPAGPGVSSGSGTEVSLYRRSMGADHFIAPLREGQIAGAKLASKDKKRRLADDKSAHFVLHNFTTRADHVVTAPFMGLEAEKQPLPPLDFLDDYEELFRAYRSGFYYWLQHHALPDEGECAKKFATLITKHALSPERAVIDASVLAVYGVPISAPDPSVDSLEWRFLAWLAKRK